MDRISALRNVETALTEFEEGQTDLDGLERRVRAVLRTYATDFEDERTAVYVVDPGATDDPGVTDDPRTTDDPGATDGPRTTDDPGPTDEAESTGRTAEIVVVAGSPGEARERAADVADRDCERATVERLDERAGTV